MNFTLDELINAIKYHGHQYDLTTLEILEGIAIERERELEELEELHSKDTDNAISEALEERKELNLERIDLFVDSFCGDIDLPENEKLKELWLGIVEILENHRD